MTCELMSVNKKDTVIFQLEAHVPEMQVEGVLILT